MKTIIKTELCSGFFNQNFSQSKYSINWDTRRNINDEYVCGVKPRSGITISSPQFVAVYGDGGKLSYSLIRNFCF
jgi:hypothetical protein